MAMTVIDALALLTPYDIDRRKVRIGPATDGGYVMVDSLHPSQTVISYGINTEYRFEQELAEAGHLVHMFDHTIDGIDAASDRMLFHREGVAGQSDPDNLLYSVADHLAKYQVHGRRMILKIDVEGAEFDALAALDDETLDRFEQIVMEVHNLYLIADHAFQRKFIQVFRKLNQSFTLFHVHANNCDGGDGLRIISGVPVSNLVELSYVRTTSVARSASRTVYPTYLDSPCIGERDKLLWFFPFAPSAAPQADYHACYDRVMLLHERDQMHRERVERDRRDAVGA